MLEDGEWNNCEHEILKEYSKVSRSSFIPFGNLVYMPDCWEGEPYYEDQPWDCKATNGFERYFNKETGLLCFQCSLKNYDDTIEYFLENIVTKICSKLLHCEVLYEEDEISTLYELSDCKLTQKEYGIKYKDDDEYESIFPIPKEEKEDKNIWYYDFKYDIEKEYR